MSYQRGRQRQRDTGLIREEREWMKRASGGRQRGEGGVMLFCQGVPVGNLLLVKMS